MSRKIYGSTVTTPFNPAKIGGKSAYAYAVEAGYTGTEEEFAKKMAEPYENSVMDVLLALEIAPVVLDSDGAVLVDANGAILVNV